MDSREQLAEQLTFLTELGVDGFSRNPAWRPAAQNQQTAQGSSPAPTENQPSQQDTAAQDQRSQQGFSPAQQRHEDLPSIRTDLGDCTRCKLSTLGRRQIVFGVGNPHARLMFIGEAPGRDEDIQGIPFVGRAGQLLTKMIEAIGLKREDVYIANVIKCRPPENRNPEPDEVASCEPFLFRQVESINPVVIVAMGTFAAQALLKSQDTISRMRGRVYRYGSSQLVPTFHPAYLLRSPDKKRDAWEDLKRAKGLLDAAQSDTGPQT